MTPILGKRKRRSQLAQDGLVAVPPANAENTAKLQALFRQHFEGTFEPLDAVQSPQTHANVDEREAVSDDVESDWEGISNEGDEATLTIHYPTSGTPKADVPRDEMKTFMTNKPPPSISKPLSTAKRKQSDLTDPADVNNDAANLKKDLALQRLLKESHLLDPEFALSHSGQTRHKAFDLRLQDMGSKTSIFKQERMPLAQRRGIMAKASERELDRRRIAQENGVILEKAVKGKKKDDTKRQRGIGAPGVGKFQGGMLKLSKKDVADIEGPNKTSKSRR
ncbi:hypothetical protein P7C71_g830, partial [Lecanoromycetidae sp. Uapishka_2]